MGLIRSCALLITCCFALFAGHAQGITEQFIAEIRVLDEHSARVTCAITVAQDSGVTMLPLQAIKYENASITSAKVNDQSVELIDYNHLWKIESYGFSGRSVDVEYDVRWEGDEAVIPILYVPWKAQDTEEGKMAVNISLPQNLFIGNHFPDIEFAKGVDGYSFDLPVVTSLVKFDLREDDSFYISGTTVVDFFIICVLAGLGIFGWQRRKTLI
jgi:hypothetical protein